MDEGGSRNPFLRLFSKKKTEDGTRDHLYGR